MRQRQKKQALRPAFSVCLGDLTAIVLNAFSSTVSFSRCVVDVAGVRPFGAFDQFKLNRLPGFERPIPFHLDGRVVGKHIFTAIIGTDKPESLGIVEPFDSSGGHTTTSFLLDVFHPEQTLQRHIPDPMMEALAPVNCR